MGNRGDLTNEQWERMEPLLPKGKTKRGRPAQDHRRLLNGIVWVLRTGAPWRDIPDRYGKWTTIYSRFQRWRKSGVSDKMFAELQTALDVDWELHFIDSTTVRAHQDAAGAKKQPRTRSLRSQSINATRNSKQMTGVLLAVQSMRLLPSREAAQFLLTNNFAAPSVARMTHDARVLDVAFSPDGKYVGSGSADDTVRVWEATTGEEVARMTHDSRVVSVAISPDGKYVVSGSWDNTARVWSYRSEDLIATSCSHVTCNFTINEGRQYLEDMFPYRAICTNLPLPEESLREIAFEALDHTGRPMRVQAAIKIIQDLLSQDKSIDSSEDEAKRIITSVVTIRLEGLSSTSIASDEDLRQAIERIEDAKSLGLDFAEFIYSLDNVCWSGSLYGYAKMY